MLAVNGEARYGTGTRKGGFNGGGGANLNGGTEGRSGGGGGTDFRISDSLYARVIVAGGGSGYDNPGDTAPGYGGGTTGGGTAGGTSTAGGIGAQTTGVFRKSSNLYQ